MKIVNMEPLFNPANNGFMYICHVDDGTFWLRSVSGNWVQLKTSAPMDTETVSADFDAFQKSGLIVTENDVKVDNSSQIIVDPVKLEPTTEPVVELTTEIPIISELPSNEISL